MTTFDIDDAILVEHYDKMNFMQKIMCKAQRVLIIANASKFENELEAQLFVMFMDIVFLEEQGIIEGNDSPDDIAASLKTLYGDNVKGAISEMKQNFTAINSDAQKLLQDDPTYSESSQHNALKGPSDTEV